MWVMIAVAIVLLALFLASELRGWQADEAAGGDAAAAPGEDHAAVVEKPLGDADTLARAGKYGEAIHVLLLRTLEELVRRLDRPLPRSLTSREILRAARITTVARTALRDIVGAVERTHFGAYPAQAGDYAACRQNFAVLQHSLRAGAPA